MNGLRCQLTTQLCVRVPQTNPKFSVSPALTRRNQSHTHSLTAMMYYSGRSKGQARGSLKETRHKLPGVFSRWSHRTLWVTPAGSPNSTWETLSARGARGALAPGLCLQQAPIDNHCLEHCRGPDSQEESRCSAHPRKSAQTVQAQRATLSLAGGRPLKIQVLRASQGLNL